MFASIVVVDVVVVVVVAADDDDEDGDDGTDGWGYICAGRASRCCGRL